jgi:hypothetical protein
MNNLNGLFDSIRGKDYQKMTDENVGLDALKKFYDKAKSHHLLGHSKKYSYDEMISVIKNMKGGMAQVRGLGLGIKLIPMNESGVKSAMHDLADTTKGKIPANLTIFRSALSNEAQSLNIDKFIDDVVIQSVKDIGEGFVKVGTTVTDVGKGVAFWAKYSKFVLPVVAIVVVPTVAIGGFWYLDTKFKILDKIKNIKRSIKS